MAEELYFMIANCTSREEARAIGKALVEQGLAKCVNITAMMDSLYVWDGQLVEDSECQLIAKLPRSRREEAVALIKERHSFEVPAIYGWPVGYATDDYAKYHLGES